MTADLHRLFTFDDWANREIAKALRAGEPAGAVRLLAHVVSAEWLWLRRLGRPGREMPVWPELTLAECERDLDALHGEWRRVVADQVPDGSSISYVNSKGEPWTSSVRDVLTHVITHGSHHRGQIVALFRGAGMVPPYVDFIEASRRGFLDGTDRPV